MGNNLIKMLSEELRKTKNLVLETRKIALAAEQTALESKKQADAAWELVLITKNQVQEELHYLRLPWWKKLFSPSA